MTNTQSTPEASTPVVPEPEAKPSVLRRAGISLMLFSLVFTGLLFASWTYLLPRFTRIQVQGKTVDLAVILPYEQSLRAQITEIESKRNVLAMPVNDAAYDTLKREAACYPLLEDLERAVAEVALQIGENAVLFSGMTFSRGTLTLMGDVRNVGPRSMTILAQFVEAVRAAPFTESLTTPVFSRQQDPVIGFHSPFSFPVRLKASDTCPSLAS